MYTSILQFCYSTVLEHIMGKPALFGEYICPEKNPGTIKNSKLDLITTLVFFIP